MDDVMNEGENANRRVLKLCFGLPGGSDGKESACNAGDLASIPGLGRSPGEGTGNPFQYSSLKDFMDCMGSQRVGYD